MRASRTIQDAATAIVSRCERADNGCLEYQGYRNSGGYGKVHLVDGLTLTHRIVWASVRGPIADGQIVCHRCDNPACVDIEHLFLGTYRDNVRDMMAKGRGGWVKGDGNARRKLTDEQVMEARRRRSSGEPLRSIGDDLGVSHSYLSRLTRGQRRETVGVV